MIKISIFLIIFQYFCCFAHIYPQLLDCNSSQIKLLLPFKIIELNELLCNKIRNASSRNVSISSLIMLEKRAPPTTTMTNPNDVSITNQYGLENLKKCGSNLIGHVKKNSLSSLPNEYTHNLIDGIFLNHDEFDQIYPIIYDKTSKPLIQCVFNDTYINWMNLSDVNLRKHAQLFNAKLAIIIRDCNSTTKMIEAIDKAIKLNITYVYVTDKNVADFSNSLPSYFNDLVDYLQSIDKEQRNRGNQESSNEESSSLKSDIIKYLTISLIGLVSLLIFAFFLVCIHVIIQLRGLNRRIDKNSRKFYTEQPNGHNSDDEANGEHEVTYWLVF